MNLSSLKVADIKSIGSRLGVKGYKNRTQYSQAINEHLRQMTPLQVYKKLDLFPYLREDLCKLLGYNTHRSRSESWESFKDFYILSTLREVEGAEKLWFLFYLIAGNKYTEKIDFDPVLRFLQDEGIEGMLSELPVEKWIENDSSLFWRLEKSGIKEPDLGTEYAQIVARRTLGLEISEEQKLRMKLAGFFASSDISYISQGLALMETMLSFEEIVSFFGFDIENYFSETSYVNTEQGQSLFKSLGHRFKQGTEIAGYVGLWLLGTAYKNIPEKVRFKNNHFSFTLASDTYSIEQCWEQGYLREHGGIDKKFRFTLIPDVFFEIDSISSLTINFSNAPIELFLMPNLTMIGLMGEGLQQDSLDAWEQLKESQIDRIYVVGDKYGSGQLPDIVWKFPRLKYLNCSCREFKLPFGSSLEDLDLEGLGGRDEEISLKLSNQTRLKKLKLRGRISEWEWSIPTLEILELKNVGHFCVESEMPALRHLSLGSVEKLQLSAMPNLETCSIDWIEDCDPANFSKLGGVKKLKLSCAQSSWPSEGGEFQNLQWLDISGWATVQFPENFQAPQLNELVCSLSQLGLKYLPRNAEKLMLLPSQEEPEEYFERFTRLSSLTIPRSSGSVRFTKTVWEQILTCTSLTHLKIGRYNNFDFSQLDSLENLEVLDIHDVDVKGVPSSFVNLKKLRTLKVLWADHSKPIIPEGLTSLPSLRFTDFPSYAGPVGRPYLYRGNIHWTGKSNLSLEESIRGFFRYVADNPSFAESVTELIIPKPRRYAADYHPMVDFSQLPNLKYLSLPSSEHSVLPPGLEACKALESLQLSLCEHLILPDWILDLPNLREIFAYGLDIKPENQQLLSECEKRNIRVHC